MVSRTIPFEEMQFGLFRKLSGYFNIAFEEVIDVAPELKPVFNKDAIITGYFVCFRSDAPTEILKKIYKISMDNSVYLGFYLVNDIIFISNN